MTSNKIDKKQTQLILREWMKSPNFTKFFTDMIRPNCRVDMEHTYFFSYWGDDYLQNYFRCISVNYKPKNIIVRAPEDVLPEAVKEIIAINTHLKLRFDTVKFDRDETIALIEIVC